MEKCCSRDVGVNALQLGRHIRSSALADAQAVTDRSTTGALLHLQHHCNWAWKKLDLRGQQSSWGYLAGADRFHLEHGTARKPLHCSWDVGVIALQLDIAKHCSCRCTSTTWENCSWQPVCISCLHSMGEQPGNCGPTKSSWPCQAAELYLKSNTHCFNLRCNSITTTAIMTKCLPHHYNTTIIPL